MVDADFNRSSARTCGETTRVYRLGTERDVLAVFNFRNEAQRVPMPSGEWQLVLRSDAAEASSDVMPAQTTFIYTGG